MTISHAKNKAFFRSFLILVLSILTLAPSLVWAQDGEALYKANCATCHYVTEKKLTGPGLAGVYDRVPQPADEWLLAWVKNSQAVIASGDAYANKIYNEYNKTQMTNFEFLSDEEVMAIMDYVKNPPVEEGGGDEVAFDACGEEILAQEKEADENQKLSYILIAISILLVVLITILTGVKRSLNRMVHERDGQPEPTETYGLQGLRTWAAANKGWVAVFALAGFLGFAKWGFDGLLTIGVYEGYKPEQPIEFSHKIHAGQNGINCVYCHTAALKGKTAGIPSLNVCMNCHAHVNEGPSGTKEIAKIYAALDYDYDTKTYGDNPTPVQWVKVHNLPDLAYFNHSQHVVAGQLDCEECHGDMKCMGVAEQHAPLTMGWCINCHQETSVQVADNGYYEDLISRMPHVHDGEVVTVETIGGLECAKCHY